MLKSTVFVFFAVVVALSLGAPSKACQDGETVEKGRYWYTCQGGVLVMKGCLSEKHARLNNHDTFKSNGFVFECVESNGGFTFKYKGCVAENGEEHMAGDSWQDDNYWYTCTAEGDHVKIDIKGCVDGGKRLNPDDTVFKADLKYVCKRYDGGNIGWNIYPNPAVTVTYNPNNPNDDLNPKVQTVPVPTNT